MPCQMLTTLMQTSTYPSPTVYFPGPVRAEALSDAFVCVCLSDVDLPVAYIGNNSIIERHRKSKIGTEVAHVTHDSDTTFKVKRSKVEVTRPVYSPPRLHTGSYS